MIEHHTKDSHRFSHSRLETFKRCPMMHHYEYVEKIPAPQSEAAMKGTLVHKAIELILKGEDPQPVYDEWKYYVDKGLIYADRDQLEYTISNYFSYYYKDYLKEDTLLIEQDFRFDLDEEDYFVGIMDNVYEREGIVVVRDYKTTSGPLKYNIDKVKTNNQLLEYVPEAEKILDKRVDAIEIDEIRIAKLDESVPLVGKKMTPSTSLETLSLTTADLYREELENQNLINDPKYANVLQQLEQRGHPLFRRIKVQITNRNIIDTIKEEMQSLYVGAVIDLRYRNKDPQKCFMCPYKNLCEHDEYKVDEMLRKQIIDNILR